MLLHDILPEHCQVVGVALQQVAAVTPLCHLVMSAVTIVKIREKILTLSGDTDIVLAAGDVLHKHFNVAREEAGVMEGALLAKPTAEEEGEIENSGQVVSDNDGYVAAEETETEAALSALASAATIGEVTETVTEAEDMPGPALATSERTPPRCRRCLPWPATVRWAVSAVRRLLKENLRRKLLQRREGGRQLLWRLPTRRRRRPRRNQVPREEGKL